MGVSIKECVQGYRMVQWMKNLGITYNSNYLKENVDILNRYSNIIENYNEVSTFLKDIYINCKNIGILSTEK